MVNWIRSSKPAKLEGLWKAVLPEGSTAPPAEFAADLFWLLHQGHILLYTDDTLVVQEAREANTPDPSGEPKKAKKKKKKKSKVQPTAEGTVEGEASPATETASEETQATEETGKQPESSSSEPSTEEPFAAPTESPEEITEAPISKEITTEEAAS